MNPSLSQKIDARIASIKSCLPEKMGINHWDVTFNAQKGVFEAMEFTRFGWKTTLEYLPDESIQELIDRSRARASLATSGKIVLEIVLEREEEVIL